MATETSTTNAASGTETVNSRVDDVSTDKVDEDEVDTENSAKGTDVYDLKTQQQMSFGATGKLEPVEKAGKTTLNQFDMEIEHQKGETRVDSPKASSLLCDDRPTKEKKGSSEQVNLFTEADEKQQTLTGGSVERQCNFENE